MRYYFTIFCLSIITICKAQSGSISGTIVDAQTQTPLVGVNVAIKSNGLTTGQTTDQNGNFEIKNLQQAKYNLQYSYIGFQTQTQTVEITNPNDQKKTTIALQSTQTNLNEVVVSASKFEKKLSDVTVSMEVLKPNIISNNNAFNFDDALNRVSGVTIINGQANIRGSSGFSYGAGSRVLMMIDELPLLSADAGDVKWNYIPIENVSQIEVIKGASSVLFGSSALGGVVNVRTGYPTSKPITKLQTFYTYYNNPPSYHIRPWGQYPNPFAGGFSAYHSRQIGKRFDLTLGVNGIYDLGYRVGEFSKRVRANINTRYRFKNEKWSAGINVNSMLDSAGTFLFWATDTLAFLPSPNTNTKQLNLRANIDPFITYTNGTNKHSIRNRVFITNNSSEKKGFNTFAVSYYSEYQYQKRKENWKGFEQSVLSFGAVNNINTITSDSLYGLRSSQNIAAYVQIDQKIKRLNYSLGIRYEYFRIEQDIYQYPVVRVGINYKIAQATFARASFGQGFRTPAVAERYVYAQAGSVRVFPNPTLTAEKGWSSEIGIKQGFVLGNIKGFLDAAGFITQYTDMIEFNFAVYPEGLGFKAKNITKARISGGEITLNMGGNIGRWNLTTSGGYTYTSPRNMLYSPTFDLPEEKYLKYRYFHLIRGDAQIQRGRISVGTNVRYNSFMFRIDDAFNNLIPGVKTYRDNNQNGDWIFDVRTAIEIVNNLKLMLNVKNILNRSYLIVPGNIGQQRSFNLQVMYDF